MSFVFKFVFIAVWTSFSISSEARPGQPWILNVDAPRAGLCVADPYSKVYLSQPDSDAKYPKTFVFECDYHCTSDSGRTEVVKASRTVVVGTLQAEMRGLLCLGVLLKQKPWGWDFDRAEPFYIYSALAKPFRDWASINVKRKPEFEIPKLLNLKSALEKVAWSYLNSFAQTQIQAMKTSGDILTAIADELPGRTELLMEQIEVLKGIENLDSSHPDYWHLVQIRSHAGWLIFE